MKANKLRLTETAIQICPFLLLMLVFTQCIGPEGPMGRDGLDGIDGINYTHSVSMMLIPPNGLEI
jgi:hypothetical protein